MTIKSSKLSFRHWSIYRDVEYAPFYSGVFECYCSGGYSHRVFTINPRFLWQRLRDWFDSTQQEAR